MKLAFLDGERKDIPLGKGHYTIGGNADDDVNLGTAVGDARATLILDQRGVTLNVEGTEPVTVNSRQVREKAILRLGDTIHVGEVAMVLRTDRMDVSTPPQPFDAVSTERDAPSKFHLRGINGGYAGQSFSIRGQLTLGPKPKNDVQLSSDLDLTLVIGSSNGRLYIKREAGEGKLVVNGVEVRHASLMTGDQIVLGPDRFLIETPGLVPGKAYTGEENQPSTTSNTQVFQAIPDLEPQREDRKERESRQGMDPATKRDAIIIGFCVALSAAMLIWLYTNL